MSDLPRASDEFVQHEVDATRATVEVFTEMAWDKPSDQKGHELIEHAKNIHSMTLELQRYRLLFDRLEARCKTPEIKPLMMFGWHKPKRAWMACESGGHCSHFSLENLLAALEQLAWDLPMLEQMPRDLQP